MGYKTIGLDINDSQLEMAKKVGADVVFNSMSNKNYVEEVKKLTDKKGCHAAAVYSASNAAYAGAPEVLRTGGLLMIIGIAPKPLDFITTFDLYLPLVDMLCWDLVVKYPNYKLCYLIQD